MPIAFFDFDGTLLRKESGVICAIPSVRAGLLRPGIGARLVGTYLLSKVGVATRTDAQRVGFRCYEGRTLEELRTIMQRLYDEHLVEFLSAPVRARVEEHRRAGDRLVILTASAFFFAEPLARAFAFDEVVGTQLVFERGVCTGAVDGPILEGDAKLAAARAYVRGRGEDLGRSAFYGDHPSDVPLLEVVGRPVAVGSHRALGRIARERGWPILRHPA